MINFEISVLIKKKGVKKMFDIVTFGSATVDIFVESDEAHVVNIRGVEREIDLYCLKYGEKIEIDHSAFEIGGGAVNTASCFAKLGLNTAAAVKIGKGANSISVLDKLDANKISRDGRIFSRKEHSALSRARRCRTRRKQ